MRVLLIDVDSKIPNLALMKISAWHKSQGDTVGFDVPDPDRVYISCIFEKNAEKTRGIATMYPGKAEAGGPGISLETVLPEHIEGMKPDYDLYPSEYSQGYTTRGCIRKCGFCIVPQKEGKIRIAQHPSLFHDDRFDTCMIMDNNLFAAPQKWQDSILSWFIDLGVKMRSPQGWDIRLLTEKRACRLREIRHAKRVVHFAWDNIEDEAAVLRGIKILKDTGFDTHHEITFYVLCGYNTTIEQDKYRCEKLRDLDVQAFAMRYRRSPELNALARWTSRPALFWSHPFSEYDRGVA